MAGQGAAVGGVDHFQPAPGCAQHLFGREAADVLTLLQGAPVFDQDTRCPGAGGVKLARAGQRQRVTTAGHAVGQRERRDLQLIHGERRVGLLPAHRVSLRPGQRHDGSAHSLDAPGP